MNNDILPFWQEIGTSTSIIAKRVSEKLGTPTSHTGTLDPMASGVVLILKGDEYFNKEKYIQKNKTYEFSILFGFDTDTHDGLGLITKTIEDERGLVEEKVLEVISSFKGLYHQRYPDFSSKKISGKSLWEYKRQGLKVPEVYIDGEITDIQLLNFKEVLCSEQIELISKQIESIKGNFRQAEILARYDATKFPETIYKARIKVVMSRGMYVRGLVRDICHKLKTFGIVIDLVRTKDGEYSKDECYLLSDYFAKELKDNPNFFEPEYKNF
jgi:tRNA pseudouridine55 synthase